MAAKSVSSTVSGNGVQGKIALMAGESTWDPLCSPDWDRETHSREAILRIKRDLMGIYEDPPPGICVVPQGDDITRVHILITGPFDTPYEGGFFHFVLRFPPNYPHTPPRVMLLTTGGGTVRFNPNLYKNGKVCLSILGTWPGPSWTAVQCLSSVLLSIQSLMNEKPYHNEPGYEEEHKHGDAKRYNEIILHETLRVAVCNAIEHNTQIPPQLQAVQKTAFLEFYESYVSNAQRLSRTLDGNVMMDPFSANHGTFDFKTILQRLHSLQPVISRELQQQVDSS